MLKIIIVAVTAIIVFIGLGFITEDDKYKSNKFQLIPVMLAVVALIACSVKIVPANTVGIIYSPIDGIQEKTLTEGLTLTSPLNSVYKLSTAVQEAEEEFTAQTKDGQYLTCVVNTKYRVDAANAFKVYRSYQTLSNVKDHLIIDYTQSALQDACAKFNIIDALSNQPTIRDLAYKALEGSLGHEGITVLAVTVRDLDAGKDIEKAISDEAVAKKAVETAKQLQESAKINAETKRIEAQATADANNILQQSLDSNVLEQKKLELEEQKIKMIKDKWNGQLPNVISNGGDMFDVSALIK